MIPVSLLKKLYPSVKEHKAVEAEVLRRMGVLLDKKYRARPKAPPGPVRYVQRNVFSILFLAIYRSLGIVPERRLLYGVVNHSIRGIVTGADNLLDDEYKELLPLAFPETAVRFKSVMQILLFDRFLFGVLDDAAESGMIAKAERDNVHLGIFSALVPIGEREAGEEGREIEILPPDELLSSIHMYRGGNLLRLAFIAPRILEKDSRPALEKADEGVYRIGLALQVIDDLTDFYEDIRGQKNNYLVSFISFEGTEKEKRSLEGILEERGRAGAPVETLFSASVAEVMERAIGEALQGFALLAGAGFWLDRRQALDLIRFLFRVRGVGSLLRLLPENDEISSTLTGGRFPGERKRRRAGG
ncbi:MAG: hypothetical protein U0411_07930 [Thermodesulfovibrionales bacterium]